MYGIAPLSLLWEKNRGFIVTIFVSWDKSQALNSCLNLDFVLSLVACESLQAQIDYLRNCFDSIHILKHGKGFLLW